MMHEKNASQDALLGALGLCAKARAMLFGVPMICEALAGKKKPYLVVSAADNAENSAKRLRDKCAFYNVRLAICGVSGAELAHAVGKTGHLAAVALTDENLCHLIEKRLSELSEDHKL
jgi:ribosomal protein L7Ae-like RNA K-turn-binding protein